jgi:long-chain acyl-CoA synthetase
VLARSAERPDAPAYVAREPDGWRATSWREYGAQVREAARAMIRLGLAPGDTVSILGFNRPEWLVFNVGAMAVGGIPAGIYTTSSPAECAHILQHARSSLLLVEDDAQLEMILPLRAECPDLRQVITMRGAGASDDPRVMSWEAFIARAEGVGGEVVDERLDALNADDLATLIYTSGTTGPPKGVMLSHDNLVWTSRQAIDLLELGPDEVGLSYLPLSHVAEQMLSIHIPTLLGSAIYFAESLERLRDNLLEVRPTYFFGVPRVWEKFHAGVEAKLARASRGKAKLVAWARRAGRTAVQARNEGCSLGAWASLRHAVADRLVLGKLRAALGLDRAHITVTGAAPISSDVLEFFADFGLPIIEVYGQSEGTGVTAVNHAGRTRFGSVGPAYPGVGVRIAEDGEVLLKGRNVFSGYFEDPEATAKTLVDGWLHSGDLGRVDEDGFYWITGRKKDILITAGGKNISPAQIERLLTDHGLIANAVVIGDGRPYLTALVSLDREEAERLVARRESRPGTRVHESEAVRATVQRIVDVANTHLARVSQVKKFGILERALSVAAGELTPTLKVKRDVVTERYANQIEEMYAHETAARAASA